jgi:TP901 family phage tail tape measure protein
MINLNLGDLVVHLRTDASQFKKSVDAAEAKMVKASQQMAMAGAKMSAAITLPLAVLGGRALGVFTRFEDAIVEVQKVTDEFTAQQLSNEISKMAQDMPIAATSLANMAADAARFGIRGTQNITKFTKTIAMMTVATDMTAEQAGESMARIASMVGMPIDEVENLGSSINELSNNFATSSSEIVDSMLRSASTMREFGLTTQQMVGLSAAMNAVSESAERAGTRTASLMMALTDPSTIKQVSDAIGMTVDQFRQMQQESPLELIQNLARILKEDTDQAYALAGALDRTARKALTAIGTDVEGLTKALDLSNKSYAEATSLLKEYEDASDTLSAKMKLLGNRIDKVLRSAFEVLAPYVERMIDFFGRLTDYWSALSVGAKKVIVFSAAIAAAIGPLLLLASGVVFVASKIFALLSVISAVVPVITSLVTVLTSIGTTILGVVLGPIGLISAAIAALTYVFLEHTETGEKVITFLADLWWYLADTVDQFVQRVKTSMGAVADALQADDLWMAARIIWAQIGLEFARGLDAVMAMIGPWYDKLAGFWDNIVFTATAAARAISNAFWDSLKGVVDAMAWVAEKALDAAYAIPGMSNDYYNDIIAGYRKVEKLRSGVSDDIGKAQITADVYYSNQLEKQRKAQEDYVPIAERAHENFLRAQDQWYGLVNQATGKAQKAMERIEAPDTTTTKTARDVESQISTTQDSGTVSRALGSFFAGALSAVSGVEKQDTEREQLRVQEDILKNLREGKRSKTSSTANALMLG